MVANQFPPLKDCQSAPVAAADIDSKFISKHHNRSEAIVFSAYFAFYMAYLFFSQENEILHWLSLVIIPSLLLFVIQRRTRTSKWKLNDMLATVGLTKSGLKNGILLAVVAGLGLSAFQLLFSQYRQEIWAQISSGKILIAFPLAFIFMFITAGFTEEFFFRGILQTRIVRTINSRLWGVATVSIMFAFYHLPYAYLNPNWPSHGDWTAALGSAFGQGILGGVILGIVYEKSNNLLACVVLHSLMNTLPAVAMIKFI